MSEKIIEVGSDMWGRFSPCLSAGPCVAAAFPQGRGFGLWTDDGGVGVVSMVWYTYPHRHCPWHRSAYPNLKVLTRGDELDWLNKNARLLARISTLPDYRSRGYARRLVAETIANLGVPFIECLTAWPDVRRLLDSVGFVKCGGEHDKAIDFWVWARDNG